MNTSTELDQGLRILVEITPEKGSVKCVLCDNYWFLSDSQRHLMFNILIYYMCAHESQLLCVQAILG